MKHYINAIRNYANFNGRASRSEYWLFYLINTILSFLIYLLSMSLRAEAIHTIFSLLVLLPSLSVGIRRIHDTGKSGWFILVPFYNLILLLSPSQQEENEYGLIPD